MPPAPNLAEKNRTKDDSPTAVLSEPKEPELAKVTMRKQTC